MTMKVAGVNFSAQSQHGVTEGVILALGWTPAKNFDLLTQSCDRRHDS